MNMNLYRNFIEELYDSWFLSPAPNVLKAYSDKSLLHYAPSSLVAWDGSPHMEIAPSICDQRLDPRQMWQGLSKYIQDPSKTGPKVLTKGTAATLSTSKVAILPSLRA